MGLEHNGCSWSTRADLTAQWSVVCSPERAEAVWKRAMYTEKTKVQHLSPSLLLILSALFSAQQMKLRHLFNEIGNVCPLILGLSKLQQEVSQPTVSTTAPPSCLQRIQRSRSTNHRRRSGLPTIHCWNKTQQKSFMLQKSRGLEKEPSKNHDLNKYVSDWKQLYVKSPGWTWPIYKWNE